MSLTDEQRALLEKVDKWSMSDPLVMAVSAALGTIDAQREEIERLKETDAEALRVWERQQKRISALEAERDAWKAKTREWLTGYMAAHPDLAVRALSDTQGLVEAERDLARTERDRARGRIAALEAEVRSLREGDREAAQVEEQIGMFLKDVPAKLAALEAEIERLKAENAVLRVTAMRVTALENAALDALRKEGK